MDRQTHTLMWLSVHDPPRRRGRQRDAIKPLRLLPIRTGLGKGMGIMQSSHSQSDSKPGEPSKPPMALDKAKEIVASSAVVVFSKTYCPFCTRVKQLLAQLGASYKAVELDVESDGSELQAALAEWTGQKTVPNVFIKGKHIGGCDDTVAMHNGGNLVPLLTEAGAIATPL